MPPDLQSQSQVQIPQPPDELFVRKHRKNTTGEKTRVYFLEKIECIPGKGILVYRVGATHPEKGWPTPEGMYALNQVKRIVREFLGLLKNPLILLGIMFYNKNKLMGQFILIFDKLYEIHVKKMEFLCPTAVATYSLLSNFLLDYGFDKDISEQFAFRFAQIIDADDAYRYILQDIATEYNPQNNIRKELKRLFDIYAIREHQRGVLIIMNSLNKLLRVVIHIPKIRRIFEKHKHFIKDMAYDEGDWYWVCTRSEYNYGGKSFAERQEGLVQPQRYEAEI